MCNHIDQACEELILACFKGDTNSPISLSFSPRGEQLKHHKLAHEL